MTTKPTIDQTQLAKLLEMPALKRAFAEASAAEEAAAEEARAAALAAKAEAQRTHAELVDGRNAIDAAIAVVEDEIRALKEKRYGVEMEIQRTDVQIRNFERALRDQHGGRLVTHVRNYLSSVADTAVRQAESEAAKQESAGRNLHGVEIMRPARAGQAMAVELREAADALRAVAARVAALEHAPVAPQELRRRIQTDLESIGLTLYQGPLPEHMVSRLVHARGDDQERAVELLPPNAAAA